MKIINSSKAPKAIGPYSQAIVHNGMLYSSGQIALDPTTNELVGQNVSEQATLCLKNLEHVLLEGGSNNQSIVKVVIYLTDMNDFSAVNAIYQAWIGDHRPARSTVAVAGLPKGALVEIECVAVSREL